MFRVIIFVWHVHLFKWFLLVNPCALLSLFHIKRHVVRVLLNIFFESAQRLESSTRPYLFSRRWFVINFFVRNIWFRIRFDQFLSFFSGRDISLNVNHPMFNFDLRSLFFLTENTSVLLVDFLALHHDYFWLDPLVIGSLKFGISSRWLFVDRNYKFIFIGYVEISGSSNCLLGVVELLVLIKYVFDFIQIRILAIINGATNSILNWSVPFIFRIWLGSSSWCYLEGLIQFYGFRNFQSLIKVRKLVYKILFFGFFLLLKMHSLLSKRCQLLSRNSQTLILEFAFSIFQESIFIRD